MIWRILNRFDFLNRTGLMTKLDWQSKRSHGPVGQYACASGSVRLTGCLLLVCSGSRHSLWQCSPALIKRRHPVAVSNAAVCWIQPACCFVYFVSTKQRHARRTTNFFFLSYVCVCVSDWIWVQALHVHRLWNHRGWMILVDDPRFALPISRSIVCSAHNLYDFASLINKKKWKYFEYDLCWVAVPFGHRFSVQSCGTFLHMRAFGGCAGARCHAPTARTRSTRYHKSRWRSSAHRLSGKFPLRICDMDAWLMWMNEYTWIPQFIVRSTKQC